MKKPLFIKFAFMAGVILLLMIPISHIDGLINERQNLQRSVISDIAQSSSRAQVVAGPILIQPYVKTEKVWSRDKSTGENYEHEVKTHGELIILPEQLQIDGTLANETRRRGIYTAQLYHAQTRIRGYLEIDKHFALPDINQYEFSEPFIMVSTSDMRGFESTVSISIADQKMNFVPGSGHRSFPEGIHAKLPELNANEDKKYEFEISFTLQGTEKLAFIPLGRESIVHLQSDWPHPSFQGNYLPVEHTITEHGFSAKWQTSYFSTNLENIINSCIKSENCDALKKKSFEVNLFDPVDLYVKSDRAIKYALLFVVLTFAGFFLFELLKSLKVHPVQYTLVGSALALFYLLLMSLAEHFAFVVAYITASFVCVGLISFYMSYALGGMKRAFCFGVALGALYAMLYGLLSSEDYALLMGSTLIFSILASFMILTRKLDWYEIGNYLAADEPKASAKEDNNIN